MDQSSDQSIDRARPGPNAFRVALESTGVVPIEGGWEHRRDEVAPGSPGGALGGGAGGKSFGGQSADDRRSSSFVGNRGSSFVGNRGSSFLGNRRSSFVENRGSSFVGPLFPTKEDPLFPPKEDPLFRTKEDLRRPSLGAPGRPRVLRSKGYSSVLVTVGCGGTRWATRW